MSYYHTKGVHFIPLHYCVFSITNLTNKYLKQVVYYELDRCHSSADACANQLRGLLFGSLAFSFARSCVICVLLLKAQTTH